MRIVIDGRYIRDSFPGIGRYTYNLIKGLGELDSGDEIVLITNQRAHNSRFNLEVLTEMPGCSLIQCPIPRFLPVELVLLPTFVRHLQPAIYHSPFFLRPYPLPCPSIVTLYDLIPLQFPKENGGLVNAILFSIFARVACRTSWIVTPSNSSANAIQKQFKVSNDCLHVVPLAPDSSFRKVPEDQVEHMRRKFGLLKPYVLHVGSHLYHKNVPGLISAWAHLKSSSQLTNHPHQLVLVGSERRELSEARRLVKKLQLEHEVRFLGTVEENILPTLYSGADLFVLPSFMEGYGFPVLEAMACGTAVLCSDIPIMHEVTGGAAWKMDPEDFENIARSLDKLLSDGQLRRALAEKGKVQCRSLNWSETAQKMLQLYHQIRRF
ncbi:glycosyltransferase family 4 protein [candidate division CSSED10-310 bacterium]|uniref:Glycosyltransferase family 4 protein n=1 Tax=candidate division CSSED10-310 bacterium TaxID=2855610 RepID=A0ABV6YTL0_UNCC1